MEMQSVDFYSAEWVFLSKEMISMRQTCIHVKVKYSSGVEDMVVPGERLK